MSKLGNDWGDPAEADPADPIASLRLDPDGPPIFAAIHGRKGCGKSEFLRAYARTWPYDALIVDPTKDLDPTGEFTRPWPGGKSWPEHEEGDQIPHHRYRIAPDRVGDPDHRLTVDGAVLLAHQHPEPTFIGIDEGRYLFASDEKIETGSDVVQNEGRHGRDFLFIANPRAVGLRPVFHVQADWIVVFEVTGLEDLKRLAGPIGMRPDELGTLVRSLQREQLGAQGEVVTGFVLINIPAATVTVFPILPIGR